MNIFKKTLIAAGTASIALSPIAAAAAPAAQTMVQAAPADLGSSDLRGKNRNGEDNDGTGLIFAVLAIAAVVAVYFITENNDNGDPISP